MSAELLIVGNRAGSPGPDGPAGGYVLQVDGKNILIDCGPGVLAELARRRLSQQIDAIIISHRHADHSADLPAYSYHQSFPRVQEPIPLFAPEGFAEYLDALDSIHGIPTLAEMRTPIRTQFELSTVEPGSSFSVAGFQVNTILASHPVPCLSIQFPELGFVYTADTAKTPALVAFSRGAKLLLSEATYPNPEGHDFTEHGHMSGFEAGELAAESGVDRLVLTHLSDYDDAEETLANARSRFPGSITLAEVGARFPL